MMSKETVSYFIKLWFWGSIMAAAILVASAHCSTTSTPKSSDTTCWLPEGCVTQYQENPNSYKAGTLLDASVIGEYQGMNLRIQSLGTYELFSENLLICGWPVAKFLPAPSNYVVLTYETVSHRTVQGVACHELVRVDEIVLPTGLGQ